MVAAAISSDVKGNAPKRRLKTLKLKASAKAAAGININGVSSSSI